MQTTADTTAADAGTRVPSSHAWRRYFARFVDLTLVFTLICMIVGALIGFCLALFAPQQVQGFVDWLGSLGEMNRLMSTVVTCLVWIPIETLMLGTLGTTPGKWVFGIKLQSGAGAKLGFGAALLRSALVCVQGLGLGLPIVALVTLIYSYDKLTKTGTTLWDRRVESAVTYLPMGPLRITAAGIAIVLTVALIGFSYA